MGNSDHNSTLSRRKYLLATGTAATLALSGCLGDSRDPVTVSVTVNEPGLEPIIDTEQDLDGGEWYGAEFILDEQLEMEYSVQVTDGPEVNVYILEHDEFEAFDDEDDFEAVEGTIWLDTDSVDDSIELDAGNYWIIADNAGLEPENA